MFNYINLNDINFNNIISNLIFQDYILLGIILFFGLIFALLKTNITFKLYYGALTGFVVFLIFNLGLNNLNDNDLELLNGFRDSLVNLKILILYISYYSILFLPILFLSDYSVNFKQPKSKIINSFYAFLLGVTFPVFIISLLLTIITNKMIFGVDTDFLITLESSNLLTSIVTFFSHGVLFNYINNYSYIISFIFLIVLFYKLTLSGLIKGIIGYLLSNLTSKKDKKDSTSHADDEDI